MPLQRPSRRTVGTVIAVAILSVILDLAFGAFRIVQDGGDIRAGGESIPLPTPRGESDVSVEEAIADRRSRREYDETILDRSELGQLLWAAQGVTERRTGYRAAPSAGALYPLELYVVVGTAGVGDVEPGVYRYRPGDHELVGWTSGSGSGSGDLQSRLREAAVDQEFVSEAAVDVVVCAVDERTIGKYGTRGKRRYVPMEAGHAGQNIYLQAESLGLSTVSVGAFDDERVRDIVGAPADQRPLYILPVGGRV